ncbi:MAG TPA: hypothetical protein VNN17_09245 [Terriglobia bacterium]|nr:hypothetical protein [Terriglobia bacterium]
MRRKNIFPHKSLRFMPFRNALLAQGILVAILADALLYWQMNAILSWHTRALEWLLNLAEVPWRPGRTIAVLPGVEAALVSTDYLDYQTHPWHSWLFLAAAIALYAVAHKYGPAPLRPLVALVALGLGATQFYLQAVSPQLPYSPEDFCAIWYRGEAYLWLLLPWIFGVGVFTLNVPFLRKAPWLPIVSIYAGVWSVVRLALALATFHYFGGIWLPVFYFLCGFLADFLYIVAGYSLAMDRAAAFLARQKEVWQS